MIPTLGEKAEYLSWGAEEFRIKREWRQIDPTWEHRAFWGGAVYGTSLSQPLSIINSKEFPWYQFSVENFRNDSVWIFKILWISFVISFHLLLKNLTDNYHEPGRIESRQVKLECLALIKTWRSQDHWDCSHTDAPKYQRSPSNLPLPRPSCVSLLFKGTLFLEHAIHMSWRHSGNTHCHRCGDWSAFITRVQLNDQITSNLPTFWSMCQKSENVKNKQITINLNISVFLSLPILKQQCKGRKWQSAGFT